MYFIKDEIEYDVYEAIDSFKDEFAYVIVCRECGDYTIVSEYDFYELVDSGEIDMIYDNPEEENGFSCNGDCDNCSENSFDELESNVEDLLNSTLKELHDLKEMMVNARECGNIGLYEKLVKVYTELFKLITK